MTNATDDKSWDSGYQPYCLRCDTMYRMRRTEFGWQCVKDDCTLQVDKLGHQIPDAVPRPEWIRRASRTILDSVIENRYSTEGPGDFDEQVRRIREAGEFLLSVTARRQPLHDTLRPAGSRQCKEPPK